MDEVEHEIRGMLRLRRSRQEIAKALGLSEAELGQRIAAMYRGARDLGVQRRSEQPRWPDPTPEEIAERAAIERQSWSEEEHRRRAGLLPPDWSPPIVDWISSID